MRGRPSAGTCPTTSARPSWGSSPAAPRTQYPAATILATSYGGGSWVSTAVGKVAPFRDAPNDGEGSGMHLNGEITAASPS